MELKWQQAFHSVRPLPELETGRPTGEGRMVKPQRGFTQAHGRVVTPKHACARTAFISNSQITMQLKNRILPKLSKSLNHIESSVLSAI